MVKPYQIFMVLLVAICLCDELTAQSMTNIDSSRRSIIFSNEIVANKTVLALDENTLPAKLPMFCAMEHRLRKNAGIWLKLRLQESGLKP